MPGSADGDQRHPLRLHRFDSLRLGEELLPHPVIGIVDASLGEHEMLPGFNILHHRRIWISYAGRSLAIGPGPSAVP